MNAPTTPKAFRAAAERLVRDAHPDATNLTVEWSFCSRRFVGADGVDGHFSGAVLVSADGYATRRMIASYVPGAGMSVR